MSIKLRIYKTGAGAFALYNVTKKYLIEIYDKKNRAKYAASKFRKTNEVLGGHCAATVKIVQKRGLHI